MFKSIGIKNFRTHKDSTINLVDLTLIIGSNNSGKSNLFVGLHYFSRLISLSNPDRLNMNYELRGNNYYSQKHSLSKDDEPLSFNCTWEEQNVNIQYILNIHPDKESPSIILCNETITIKGQNEEVYTHGQKEKSSKLQLRRVVKDSNTKYKKLLSDFFQDLSSFYYYNFQPSFLKGEGIPLIHLENKSFPGKKRDYIKDFKETNYYPNVPSELGKEGSNLQEILMYIKEYEEETYNRFFGYLKRFVKNFNGLIIKENQIKWQFDMVVQIFRFMNLIKYLMAL